MAKPLQFIGTSRKDLISFPEDARKTAGFELDKVQNGKEPSDWKPMKTIGRGVEEIRIEEKEGIFRVIYVARLDDMVYVLHCFQKKTQKTSPKDLETARQRYKALQRGDK